MTDDATATGEAGKANDARLANAVFLVTAFTAGWVIMQLEILGGRLLAPFFGYSIYQWGALIGVVMSAMAAGYALGGRVGDSPRAGRFLLTALTVSALFVLIVPQFPNLYLPAMRGLGPAWGAMAGSVILLGVPSLLLATTSPIVIRLTATERIASSAGRVYAVSTLGSIGGTFFTAFVAIPNLGMRLSHIVAAILLLMTISGLAWVLKSRWHAAAAAVGVALCFLPVPDLRPPGVYSSESVYNIIHVSDRGGYRYLHMNYTAGVESVMAKEGVLTGRYHDGFIVGPHITEAKSVLFLGVAGGTSLKQLVTLYPDLEVTGVDLDPEILQVANRYFGLSELPRIRLVASDARWFLSTTEERYDIIAVDLYLTGHIPFFVTSQEFFALTAERLTDDGIVIINIFAPNQTAQLLDPFVRTLRSVFPSVFRFRQVNHFVVATKRAIEPEEMRRRLNQPGTSADIEHVLQTARDSFALAEINEQAPIFTDNQSDVEQRSFRALYGQ